MYYRFPLRNFLHQQRATKYLLKGADWSAKLFSTLAAWSCLLSILLSRHHTHTYPVLIVALTFPCLWSMPTYSGCKASRRRIFFWILARLYFPTLALIHLRSFIAFPSVSPQLLSSLFFLRLLLISFPSFSTHPLPICAYIRELLLWTQAKRVWFLPCHLCTLFTLLLRPPASFVLEWLSHHDHVSLPVIKMIRNTPTRWSCILCTDHQRSDDCHLHHFSDEPGC